MILYGASGHSNVIIDCIELSNQKVDFLFDDNPSLNFNDKYEVIHGYNPKLAPEIDIIISIGDNSIRRDIVEKCEHKFGIVFHPSAIISNKTKIDIGSVVFAGVVIQPKVNIGKHSIINTNASIDHDCVIGDFVHIAPGTTICGGVNIGEGTLIGAGSIILPNLTIGKWSIIGAGSVVTKNIPDNEVWYGSPARKIK